MAEGDKYLTRFQLEVAELRTPAILRELFPKRNPVVTVHDGASHAMAWLGGALGTPCVSLGVDEFGQSGSVADLYRTHDLDAGSIVNAALAALSLQPADEQNRR